jgi:hypothetical protein
MGGTVRGGGAEGPARPGPPLSVGALLVYARPVATRVRVDLSSNPPSCRDVKWWVPSVEDGSDSRSGLARGGLEATYTRTRTRGTVVHVRVCLSVTIRPLFS